MSVHIFTPDVPEFGAELRVLPVLGKLAKVETGRFSLPQFGHSLQTRRHHEPQSFCG
jgi:hypothetical protein